MHTRYAALYLLTACALTWPLAANLTTSLPLGTEPSVTVPLFNLWTLRWNAEQLLAGYRNYWNAPIFHPTPGAFALSDPQPLTGALFALPYILSNNQALAYNLTLLLALTLNGYAAFRLLLVTGVPSGPALLGGLLAQALPFTSNELGVIQLTALFPIFFTLAAAYTFTRTPTLRPALTSGGWLAATFLTSSYYGLFLTLFLAVSMLVLMRRDLLRLRPALCAIAAAGLAALLLLPVLPAQAQLTSDYTRSDATIRRNSAQPVDFLRLGSRSWGRATLPWLRERGGSGQRLYPGTGLLALATLGLLRFWIYDLRLRRVNRKSKIQNPKSIVVGSSFVSLAHFFQHCSAWDSIYKSADGRSTPCCAIISPASSNYAARFVSPFSPRSSSSAWPATGLRCCGPAGDERRRAEARDQGSGGRDQGAEDK
jgi:hypothetical protein